MFAHRAPAGTGHWSLGKLGGFRERGRIVGEFRRDVTRGMTQCGLPMCGTVNELAIEDADSLVNDLARGPVTGIFSLAKFTRPMSTVMTGRRVGWLLQPLRRAYRP